MWGLDAVTVGDDAFFSETARVERTEHLGQRVLGKFGESKRVETLNCIMVGTYSSFTV
jgi:hypothetical protein